MFNITQKCKVENCEGLGHLKSSGKRYLQKGYCTKHYSPDNCRWATIHQQNSNRRDNNDVVGVYYAKSSKLWIAQLKADKTTYRKTFKSKDDAVKYRKQLELKHIDFLYSLML